MQRSVIGGAGRNKRRWLGYTRNMTRAAFSVLAILASCAGACSSTAAPTAPSAAAMPTLAPPTPAPDPIRAPATASYRVTFQATWAAATHPDDFPSSAHFSPLVGGTHAAGVTFWREGAFATEGIKDMAERGLTSTLSAEIATAIAAGTAGQVVTGGNIGGSPGLATAEFEVSQSFPLVTLVSMIAPSPDWFVGVSSEPLYANNVWVEERRFELVPWDAGTDSGVTFMSPDLVSAPRAPIARIVTAPLSPGGRITPLGTFTFTRVH